MKKKQLSLMLVFAMIAGFIGGAVSNHIIQTAFAEKAIKPHETIIRAGRFELVDEMGAIHAILMLDRDDPYLYMCKTPMLNKYRINANYAANLATRKNISISYEGIKIYDPDGYRSLIRTNEYKMKGPHEEVKIAFDSLFSSGPHISIIQDGRGKSTLGCVELVTKSGTTKTRSAASLVLFDEKGNVIWSTPE